MYWIATVLRRREGAGPTVVVSPLLALMRNQVAAARKAGIRAETINSANVDDWREVEARIGDDDLYDIAQEVQHRCEGHPGTNSDVQGYFAELQRFQD